MNFINLYATMLSPFKQLKAWYHDYYRPLALESSPLAILTLNILHEILSYLPSSSAVSFSISCMQLKRLLGEEYITKLANDTVFERVYCLYLLERDLPEHVLCSICKKLHWMKNAPHFKLTLGREMLACIYQENTIPGYHDRLGTILGRNFSSTLIRMAMKRSKQDPNCRRILDVLGYDSSPSSSVDYLWQTRDTVSFSQQGKLVIHSQTVHIPSKSRTSCVFRESLHGSGFPGDLCRHLSLRTGREGAWI